MLTVIPDTLKVQSNSFPISQEAKSKAYSHIKELQKLKVFNNIKFSLKNSTTGVLYLTFNPNTFLDSKDNSKGLTFFELQQKIKKLDELLKKEFHYLLVEPVENWKLLRLDLTQYFQTNQLFCDYLPVFQELHTRGNLIKSEYNKDTLYFMSKGRDNRPSRTFHIKVENKNKQLKDAKIITEQRIENLLQIEVSFTGAQSIKRKTQGKIKNLSDLLNSPELMQTVFRNTIQKYLFKDKNLESDIKIFNSMDDLKLLEKLKKDKKTNSLLYLIALQNLENNYSIRPVSVLASKVYDKDTVKRQEQEFNKYRKVYKRTRRSNTAGELYLELYSKLMDTAA